MADTYEWQDDQRRAYIHSVAGSALFTDEEYSKPRYVPTTIPELPVRAWETFHSRFTEFVFYNLSDFRRISDQKWRRLTRAQFAILDQEIVNDAFADEYVSNLTGKGAYAEASGQICQWLKDNGYCISADSPLSPIPVSSPVMPMGGGSVD